MKTKKRHYFVMAVLVLSLPVFVCAQSGNHFCGQYAGISNTTGCWNTFCGNGAGMANTTGNANSFFGFHSGFSNTTGCYNTFLGFCAGYSNTIGNQNTLIGFRSGQYNTTGSYNTFLGQNAGYSNTTGVSNTFVGYESGKANKTHSANTFVGVQAGKLNALGERNTFLGLNAGYSNNGGDRNTFLGTFAGNFNKTGDNNTFVGYSAGSGNVSGSGNVFIGYQAGFHETGSNKLYIANSQNSDAVLIYGDFSSRMVGIAMTPYYEMDVNGDVRAYNFIKHSDIRLKKSIKPIEKALDQIARLRGVTFNWKDESQDKARQLGLVAQEVEKVFPQVVSTDQKGYKSVDYSNLVAPLIEAVKELKAENDELRKMLEVIEKKMKQ